MNEAMHLRLLSRISRLVQQDEFLEELREAQSPESAWKSITEFDHNLT